jgi:hypothetical protein
MRILSTEWNIGAAGATWAPESIFDGIAFVRHDCKRGTTLDTKIGVSVQWPQLTSPLLSAAPSLAEAALLGWGGRTRTQESVRELCI